MKQGAPLVRLSKAVVLTGIILCANSVAASSVVIMPSMTVLLAQAEQATNADHARFLSLLAQLHQHEQQLTPAQRWHMRELDAWQLSFEGDYRKADPIFQDIIDHSDDSSLSIIAMAWMVKDKFDGHHYVEAYALANTLMAALPTATDPKARLVGLGRVIEMWNSSNVGQYELALTYARQMKASFPSPEGQCTASVYETHALLYAGKLTGESPEFQKAIDLCIAAKRPLLVDSLRLGQAGQLVDEGHAGRAIVYLHRMTPEIQRTHYPAYIAGLSVTLADAYQSLGDIDNARKFALASLATPGIGSSKWLGQAANEILYSAEKKAGHDAAALTYYEKYVSLYKDAMDDTKARALAYQMVKQQVQDKKLKLDTLGKQNKILELRQALASQAQKTSGLYIALLLVVIAFIALAMFWLRRSQLRFRRMARHDGLTGAFNRGHFFDQAGRLLRRLHKAKAGVCLVVLDLDHFKRVNDTYGHAAGDEVLQHAVMICRRELRGSDVFGRLGGEEFGILMPACSREQGIEIAGRIRHSLASTPIVLSPQTTIMVCASLGLAYSAGADRTLHQLLSDADVALYRAKNAGRNQVDGGIDVSGNAVSADAESFVAA
jgi:diguanylate cyclase (GGDEF)-like protein